MILCATFKPETQLGISICQPLHLNASALEMALAVPSFVFTAPGSCLPRTADCFGPVDSWIQANPVAAHQPPGYTREDSVECLICGLSSNFGDFTWLKFSSHNPQSPVLKEQKLFSPDGSAFAQRHYTRRVN